MNEMNPQDMIEALRKQGYVVVAFHPDYLHGAKAEKVETAMTLRGWEVIKQLAMAYLEESE